MTAEPRPAGRVFLAPETQQPQRRAVAERLMADHPEVFGRLHSEGEGIRLVKKTAKWLVENGHVLLLPQLVMASGSKYAGYWLGKHYKKLPEGLIRSLTMNPAYWEGEAGDGR